MHTGRGKPNNKCRNCGGQYPHEGDCPAHGRDYKACSKMNHFLSNKNQLKGVNQMTQTERKVNNRDAKCAMSPAQSKIMAMTRLSAVRDLCL